MASGYEAVPEELRGTAGKIGQVVAKGDGMRWNGPSGDYGHGDVEGAWRELIDGLRRHVAGLGAKANEHGDGLVAAASGYTAAEGTAKEGLDKAGQQAGQQLGEPGGAVSGAAGGSGIAERLDPGGAAHRTASFVNGQGQA